MSNFWSEHMKRNSVDVSVGNATSKLARLMSEHLKLGDNEHIQDVVADWKAPSEFWHTDDNHAAALVFRDMLQDDDYKGIYDFFPAKLHRRDRHTWAKWIAQAAISYRDRRTVDIPALEDVEPIDETTDEFLKTRQNAYAAKNRAKAKEARRPGPRDVQAAYMSVIEGNRFREKIEHKNYGYDADVILGIVRALVETELRSKGFDAEQTHGKLEQMLGDRLMS